MLTSEDLEEGSVTTLLRDWTSGNQAALERLFEIVYPELRRIAGALFRDENASSLLQPTSVVNELFLKLIRYVVFFFGPGTSTGTLKQM